jgi:class 3 adenylate cyclase
MIRRLLVVLFVLVLLPSVLAEVSVSNPNEIYNLGDTLVTSVQVSNIEGLFGISLLCNSKKTLFYAEYLILDSRGQEITKSIKLKDNPGRCQIIISLDETEIGVSPSFLISNKINLEVLLDKEYFLPGEDINLKGKARKDNGENLNGELIILIDNESVSKIPVVDGNFNQRVGLGDLKDYTFDLIIQASDKERFNFGEFKKRLSIVSVPTSIKVDMNSPLAGEKLEIKPYLLDQGGREIKKVIQILVYSSDNRLIFNKEINSGENLVLDISSNAKVGEWRIKAMYENIESSSSFYISENEIIEQRINGSILTIRNVGNIPYNKIVSVEMSNGEEIYKQDINPNLNVGEERNFKLSAPNGQYAISLQGNMLGHSYLTGNVINIKAIQDFAFLKNPIFLISLIVIVVGLIFTQGRLRRQLRLWGEYSAKETEKRQYTEVKLQESEQRLILTEREKNRIKEIFERYTDKAVANKIIQTPNLAGEKRVVTALFIDIRGFTKMSRELGADVIEVLNKYFKVVSDAVYANNGIINHLEADEVFALFNAVEPQADHINRAVKASVRIMKELNKLKQTGFNINVGIGVHSGSAIVGRIGSDRMMKFTTIGDTINLAKRLEESAKNKIFVSRKVNDIIKDSFKTRRIGILNLLNRAIEVYEVIYDESRIS